MQYTNYLEGSMSTKIATKAIFLFLTTGLAFQAYSDSQSFTYDGTQKTGEIKLYKELTKMIERTLPYEDKCQRQVEDGHKKICKDIEKEICETIPGVCGSSDQQVCQPNPPQEVCTPIPAHEVCSENPPNCYYYTDTVCKERPRKCKQVCSAGSCREICVGGDTFCTNVEKKKCTPSEKSCHTVGETESCHTVDTGQTCSTESVYTCQPDQVACHRVTEQECHEELQYKTESYTCTKYRTVKEEVRDYLLEAVAKLNFKEDPESSSLPKEKFTFDIDENGKPSLKVDSSGKYIITSQLQDFSINQVESDQKKAFAEYTLHFISVEKYEDQAPIEAEDIFFDSKSKKLEIHLNNDSLIAPQVDVKIIKKKPVLNKFTTLLEKDINKNNLQIFQEDQGTIVFIDLSKEGISWKKGQYTFDIELDLFPTVEGILNPSLLPKVKVKGSKKIQLSKSDL